MRHHRLPAGATRRTGRALGVIVSVLFSLSASGAAAQPTAIDDYIVGRIPLPASNTAGVAYVGTDVFVGQGVFGLDAQSVLRVAPDGTTTTLVTGLSSLGGMDYDVAHDRLLFTDNALELGGASGDTLYGLPAPRTAAGPVAAAALELLASGSIPTAANVLALPDGTALVSDADGQGIGRVVEVDGGVATDLITGRDFVSGLALTAGGEVLLGEVDAVAFAGSVHRFDLAGTPLGSLATGLSGSFDAVLDDAGHLLVSGGFTGDFASSTVVRIAPNGDVAPIATGYGFTGALAVDGPSGQVAVLDFGVAAIDTLTPVDHLTAGGRAKKDCQVEWWGAIADLDRRGRPLSRWTCHDGASCDRDGAADGRCTFNVGACLAVRDARLPACRSASIGGVVVKSKHAAATAASLQAAVEALVPASDPVCSRPVTVAVPVGRKGTALAIKTIVNGKRGDQDRLVLRCRAALER